MTTPPIDREVDGSRGWNSRIWRIAGPVILSNLSVPMLGAVDTAVMGHLPDPAYLGAVAIGAQIFAYLYWGFGFLRMGTTGLTAQAYGHDDPVELRASLYRALMLALGIAFALLLLQGAIGWTVFPIVESAGASADVTDLSRTYYEIRIWGAPAALMNYALLGWFFGLQDARWPLVIQLVTNGLNIALDLLFVVGLDMDIDGVAAATVIAEWSGVALGGFVALNRLRHHVGGSVDLRVLGERDRVKRLVAINRDIFIRTLCLLTAFAYFTLQGARFGELTLAANAVLHRFLDFTAFGLDGIAHAVEALVGQAVGRKDRRSFVQASKFAFLWAGILSLGVVIALLLFGRDGIALLTDITDVRTEAARYLVWVAIMPLVSVWCFTLDGIFIGATRGRELRNGMILSLLGFFIAAQALMTLWGNHGLWAAMVIFMALRGLTLARYFPRVAAGVGPERSRPA